MVEVRWSGVVWVGSVCGGGGRMGVAATRGACIEAKELYHL